MGSWRGSILQLQLERQARLERHYLGASGNPWRATSCALGHEGEVVYFEFSLVTFITCRCVSGFGFWYLGKYRKFRIGLRLLGPGRKIHSLQRAMLMNTYTVTSTVITTMKIRKLCVTLESEAGKLIQRLWHRIRKGYLFCVTGMAELPFPCLGTKYRPIWKYHVSLISTN